MPTIADIAAFLEELAPPSLAEEWDNVGLLAGDRSAKIDRMMTCLTVTPASAAEAIARGVGLIVTHHPLPFRPIRRVTTDVPSTRMLWDLIRAGVAIYSPHTAFDSAREGINRRLAEGLALRDIVPIIPAADAAAPPGLGSGRVGRLAAPCTLAELAAKLKTFLSLAQVARVGAADRRIATVAVACGSAGEFLDAARARGCDVLVTGETRFHTCLEAEATDVALLLAGHYASERFAVEQLADVLARRFADVEVWASRDERDPIDWD